MTASPSNPRIPDADVDPMFPDRWSPRAYLSSEPIAEHELRALVEAARWAPSSMNEQPWVLLVATWPADHDRFVDLLREMNQAWAKRAPVLMFILARKAFAQSGKKNRTAEFDCGAAWMSLALQARKLGLYAHAMAGFDHDRAYEVLKVPRDQYRILAAVAIGRKGPPSLLDDEQREREVPSGRHKASRFVFHGDLDGGPLATSAEKSSRSETDNRQLWSYEYDVRRGIDLGYRPDEVPEVVTHLQRFLGDEPSAPLTVLDVGCGRGRVGMHLLKRGYRVVAFDFVASAIHDFARLAEDAGLSRSLLAFQQDMTVQWDIADSSIDVVLAVTIMNNLVTPESQQRFKNEVLRVLCPGGLFVVQTYLPQDSYYGELLRQSDSDGGVVNDPVNGIAFRVYSAAELKTLLEPELTIVDQYTIQSESCKYRRTYERTSGIFFCRC